MMKKYRGGIILGAFRFAVVSLLLAHTPAATPAFGQESFAFEPRMVFDALRLAYGDLIEGMGRGGGLLRDPGQEDIPPGRQDALRGSSS